MHIPNTDELGTMHDARNIPILFRDPNVHDFIIQGERTCNEFASARTEEKN
jgi:hypothetical protein